jgi:alpha-1,2-mannosyltransferase
VTAPARADLRLAALICGVVGLYDVAYVTAELTRTAVLGMRIDLLYSDFLVFHAASRAFFDGRLDIVYDIDALTHLQNTLYVSHIPFELGFRPFLYPPLWLLAVLPFGLLPLKAAVALFLVLTAGAALIALRAIGLRWPVVAAVLTAPAAVWIVLSGQNTYLSLALLYGGLALLDRRPVLAGVLLGCLAYKPQVWLLVPVALLCAREWRALLALVVTVALLSIATLLLFGADFWIDFLQAARRASSGATAAEMFDRVRGHMATIVAAAKIVGAPDGLAMAAQIAGSLAALAAVCWAFFRHPTSDERTAVLAAASVFVSPYTLNYDLLLLMPAVALLFLRSDPRGYRPGERLVYLATWLVPHFCPLLNTIEIPVTPLVILAFGAIALVRLNSVPKVELPTAAGAR